MDFDKILRSAEAVEELYDRARTIEIGGGMSTEERSYAEGISSAIFWLVSPNEADYIGRKVV